MHWAVKEYLDNVADFCSVYSLFILVMLLVDYAALIANLLLIRERGHGHYLPSERAIVKRAVYLFTIFLAVAAPVAAVAYYFGDGQTFMHYLQKYMDEVAASSPPLNKFFLWFLQHRHAPPASFLCRCRSPTSSPSCWRLCAPPSMPVRPSSPTSSNL
jgi:hypothetical protein